MTQQRDKERFIQFADSQFKPPYREPEHCGHHEVCTMNNSVLRGYLPKGKSSHIWCEDTVRLANDGTCPHDTRRTPAMEKPTSDFVERVSRDADILKSAIIKEKLKNDPQWLKVNESAAPQQPALIDIYCPLCGYSQTVPMREWKFQESEGHGYTCGSGKCPSHTGMIPRHYHPTSSGVDK